MMMVSHSEFVVSMAIARHHHRHPHHHRFYLVVRYQYYCLNSHLEMNDVMVAILYHHHCYSVRYEAMAPVQVHNAYVALEWMMAMVTAMDNGALMVVLHSTMMMTKMEQLMMVMVMARKPMTTVAMYYYHHCDCCPMMRHSYSNHPVIVIRSYAPLYHAMHCYYYYALSTDTHQSMYNLYHLVEYLDCYNHRLCY